MEITNQCSDSRTPLRKILPPAAPAECRQRRCVGTETCSPMQVQDPSAVPPALSPVVSTATTESISGRYSLEAGARPGLLDGVGPEARLVEMLTGKKES
jgi:hypothetical protein